MTLNRKHLYALLGILILCVTVRIWLITHTEVIARDGTRYISMARDFPADPKGVIRGEDYHIGYPLAALGIQRCLRFAKYPDSIDTWDMAGQVTSLLASLAALCAIWLFAGLTFNWTIAGITSLLFGLTRKWSALGSDVISDALSVCLQMWGVVLAILVLRYIQRKSRWALVLAVGVGLCGGLGYLVRPEALLVPGLAGFLWLVCQIRKNTSWKLTLGSMALAGAFTLLCALPYMLAIDGVSKKKSLGDMVSNHSQASDSIAKAAMVSSEHVAAGSKLLGQLFEAIHPLLAGLACIWIGAQIFLRKSNALPPSSLHRPAFPGTFMALGSLAIMSIVLMNLHMTAGYLSHRHTMFLAALFSPLAGAGLLVLTGWLTKINRIPHVTSKTILIILIVAISTGLALHTLRPLHPGKEYLRDAGYTIGARLSQTDYLLSQDSRVLHYAAVPGKHIGQNRLDSSALEKLVRHPKATHLVLTKRGLAETCLKQASNLEKHPSFQKITQMDFPDRKRPDTIYLYRILPQTTSREKHDRSQP
jgi:hypothetical protein